MRNKTTSVLTMVILLTFCLCGALYAKTTDKQKACKTHVTAVQEFVEMQDDTFNQSKKYVKAKTTVKLQECVSPTEVVVLCTTTFTISPPSGETKVTCGKASATIRLKQDAEKTYQVEVVDSSPFEEVPCE